MMLVRYQTQITPNYGLVENGNVYEAMGHPPFGRFTQGVLVGPLDEVDLLAPIKPGKIVALARNYPDHAEEQDAQVPDEPLLFLKAPSSVIGPGATILLPALSKQVDHEAELAVVIGEECQNVSEDEAWDVVLGITAANDVTARDLQRSDDQWTRAKSFDTFCPLGPAIVTHLKPRQMKSLEIACRVNGKVRQKSNISEMVFSIPEIIAYISVVMTLEPGDVILTGTPSGVGPLKPGDVVEVEIEEVGTLRNPVETAES
ncbi:MAG: fumarylacetoacetate hydrolase family protein [Anaerolineae bacterium]